MLIDSQTGEKRGPRQVLHCICGFKRDNETTTCCDQQIKGLLGLGLIGNRNLEVKEDGTPFGPLTFCRVKDLKKEPINGRIFDDCCKEFDKDHAMGAMCSE